MFTLVACSFGDITQLCQHPSCLSCVVCVSDFGVDFVTLIICCYSAKIQNTKLCACLLVLAWQYYLSKLNGNEILSHLVQYLPSAFNRTKPPSNTQTKNISFHIEYFSTKLWSVWPFLNGGLYFSSNTGLVPPTTERSALACTSSLPSLLRLPQASDHNHRKCLSSFLCKPTYCLPSALYLYQNNNPVLEDYSNLTGFFCFFMMHQGWEGHNRLVSFFVRLQEFQKYAGQTNRQGRTKYTNHRFEISTSLTQTSKL